MMRTVQWGLSNIEELKRVEVEKTIRSKKAEVGMQ